jgi:hypothetical protein
MSQTAVTACPGRPRALLSRLDPRLPTPTNPSRTGVSRSAAVTVEAAAMAGVPLAGTSWIPGRNGGY